MALLKDLEPFLKAGKKLIPIKRDLKTPVYNDYKNKDFTVEELTKHRGNIGWLLSNDDLIIDVDPRNGGDKSYIKLLGSLKLYPTVMTPGGGFHIYLKYNRDLEYNYKKNHKDYPGIDFLSKGRYIVIPPSYVSEYRKSYEFVDKEMGTFMQIACPDRILEVYNSLKYKIDKDDLDLDLEIESKLDGEDDDLAELERLSSNSDWPEEKVRELLFKLDPSMDNDPWIDVGMALHNWDPLRGFDLWEEWSKPGTNYKDGETAKRWAGFRHKKNGVTLGTLVYMAKDVVYEEQELKLQQINDKIWKSGKKEIEFKIIPEIRKETFNNFNKEILVNSIRKRLKVLTNVAPSINDMRLKLAAKGVSGEVGKYNVDQEFDDSEEGGIPKWCKNWVYVNTHCAFIDLRTLQLCKTEAFNLENSKFVPSLDAKTKPSAFKYICDKGYINKVDGMAYLPQTVDPIYIYEGKTFVNTFNHNLVPKAAEEYTPAGLDAIEKIKRHFRIILNTQENAEMMLQWIAFQVQYPGEKLLWAMLIQSVEGLGKSFIGGLMRALLGNVNVGVVSPTQICSDYNGWAVGSQVVILEEISIKGHNRYEVTNQMKPLITDNFTQINEKFVKPYVSKNVTNYIGLTNDKSAVPLELTDRRWYIIFCWIQSLEELGAVVGMDVKDYFPMLFDLLLKYPKEIRKFFQEYEITSEFKRLKQAPMSEDKKMMIATDEAGFEGLFEARELMKKGSKFYNHEVICSTDLFEDINTHYPDIIIETSRRNIILKKMGFTQYPKPIRIDDKVRRVYVKKGMTKNEILASLLRNRHNYLEDYFDDL